MAVTKGDRKPVSGEVVDGGTADEPSRQALIWRCPTVDDGAKIWRLVKESGVLDENSCYSYLLMCRDFADSCLVVEQAGRLAGFVVAYHPPREPDVVFVWQVAVADWSRGQGIGRQLLDRLLDLPANRDARFMEATVTQSNVASRRLFESLARRRNSTCQWQDGFSSDDFGDADHEAEPRLRIGPLSP